MNKTLLTALAVSLAASAVWAEDFESNRPKNWHQWRGPNADGVSPEGNPPIRWDEETNIRWKVEIPGSGSASPIVWDDSIYLLTAIRTDRTADEAAEASSDEDAQEEDRAQRPRRRPGQAQRQREGRPGRRGGRRGGFGRQRAPSNYYQYAVICLDRQTGETRWQKIATEAVPHEAGHSTNTFASSSPVTDGKFLYASFGSRGIYCYDLEGNLQWERDLGEMQTRAGFGEGISPTLHGETLVVNWDHEGESSIFALDAKTGETRWQIERDEVTTWATPLVVESSGRAQVITNGTNRSRSYDLETGELIWECGGQVSNPIASPILRDNLVFLVTGHRGYATYAIPLDASGDITDTDKIAWRRTDVGSYIASPILYDDVLYVTKSRDAILSAIDPGTGETIAGPKRLTGLNTLYASPVAAAGRVYFSSREGATAVIEHGPDLNVLATNRLDDGIDASPAIVGNQLFIRGEKHLYCIEEQ